ncbi:MAG TPA: hypothetical protein DIC52_13825, partial [Candidatus Latescibacteria bacterium]|nr:hypothetical protein [Candidatus Latescibacterota bacterium]
MKVLRLFFLLPASALAIHAQQEAYPPGTFQLTAEIDLHLQPTRLSVPYGYTSNTRPADHSITLNLPPGFRVRPATSVALKIPSPVVRWTPCHRLLNGGASCNLISMAPGV